MNEVSVTAVLETWDGVRVTMPVLQRTGSKNGYDQRYPIKKLYNITQWVRLARTGPHII